jgi:Zn-dependent peptidase ImmA (M78 family)
LIRDLRARQELVKDALLDDENVSTLNFIGRMSTAENYLNAAAKIEETFGFELAVFRACKSASDAFGYLRANIESKGVFVLLVDNLGSHHSTISVDSFRGFALADKIAPFVAVNANDAQSAWSFTLLHEVAHLFLGATGISGNNGNSQIERFCNDVASEILVPSDDLSQFGVLPANFDALKGDVTAFARERNVSSTLIAYRLFRAHLISQERFDALRGEYRRDFLEARAAKREKGRETAGGPSYHVVRQHRLGQSLVGLVERMIYSGSLSTTKAGKVLGVKAKNVQGVIEASRPRHIANFG